MRYGMFTRKVRIHKVISNDEHHLIVLTLKQFREERMKLKTAVKACSVIMLLVFLGLCFWYINSLHHLMPGLV